MKPRGSVRSILSRNLSFEEDGAHKRSKRKTQLVNAIARSSAAPACAPLARPYGHEIPDTSAGLRCDAKVELNNLHTYQTQNSTGICDFMVLCGLRRRSTYGHEMLDTNAGLYCNANFESTWPQNDAKRAQDVPKRVHTDSKIAQVGLRWPQDGTRWPKNYPKWIQEGTTRHQKGSQMATRRG